MRGGSKKNCYQVLALSPGWLVLERLQLILLESLEIVYVSSSTLYNMYNRRKTRNGRTGAVRFSQEDEKFMT